MYVCTYVCTYVCMHVCIYVCTYVYFHIYTYMHYVYVCNVLGLKEVGIFRLPGSTTRVNELKESFNEGLSTILELDACTCTPRTWTHARTHAHTMEYCNVIIKVNRHVHLCTYSMYMYITFMYIRSTLLNCF